MNLSAWKKYLKLSSLELTHLLDGYFVVVQRRDARSMHEIEGLSIGNEDTSKKDSMFWLSHINGFNRNLALLAIEFKYQGSPRICI
jgi:hypothetical protein